MSAAISVAHLNEVGVAAAEVMGDPLLASKASDIVRISAEGDYIFHGTRNEDFLDQIEAEGVEPRTPEGRTRGEGCSFWTAHERLFFSQSSDHQTYDTTFFHYAHLKTRGIGYQAMAVCIADANELRAQGIVVPENGLRAGYLSIDELVPRNLLDIIKVVRAREEPMTPRQNGQAIERDLLSAMWDHFRPQLRLNSWRPQGRQ